MTLTDIDRITRNTTRGTFLGTLLSFTFAVFAPNPAAASFATVGSAVILFTAIYLIRNIARQHIIRKTH